MNKGAKFYESFPTADKPSWSKAASAEIKGADPDETLKWKTPDGLVFKPCYDKTDADQLSLVDRYALNEKPAYAQDARHWHNMPEVLPTDEVAANNVAMDHLRHEAEGIVFNIEKTRVHFDRLLNGISWENCSVSFYASEQFPLTDLINYISESNYSYGKIQGAMFWKEGVILPPALPSLNGFRFAGVFIPGETPVNQISRALVAGVQTIDTFMAEGYRLNEIVRHIAFNVPVGPELLVEVAKFRALRILWYQIVRAYGLQEYAPSDLLIHARSEKWLNENFQPHGNMLKGTVAAIAALSGGADAISIEPEDGIHTMMSRVARNVSMILREESKFGKVNDPFAGAYGIEVLTQEIARAAWKKFQSMQPEYETKERDV